MSLNLKRKRKRNKHLKDDLMEHKWSTGIYHSPQGPKGRPRVKVPKFEPRSKDRDSGEENRKLGLNSAVRSNQQLHEMRPQSLSQVLKWPPII
jgi:hypothetical protein